MHTDPGLGAETACPPDRLAVRPSAASPAATWSVVASHFARTRSGHAERLRGAQHQPHGAVERQGTAGAASRTRVEPASWTGE